MRIGDGMGMERCPTSAISLCLVLPLGFFFLLRVAGERGAVRRAAARCGEVVCVEVGGGVEVSPG